MLNIDKYAYASKLRNRDPRVKLIFAVTTIGVCLWANSIPVSILILIIMSWITICKGGMTFPLFFKLMLIPMSFLVLGVLSIAFGISLNQYDLRWSLPMFGHYFGISETGMMTAVILFFKALGSVSCLYYLSLNTPMVDLLSVLKKMKCPKLMIELMGLIYRFIFVFIETVEIMITAQTARLGYDKLSCGFRSFGMLASTLFIRAYKRADDLYVALEARGYEGEINILEESFESRPMEKILPIMMNLCLIILTLLLRHTGGLIG